MSKLPWQPSVALVTGASSGIGHATALALAARGITVVAAARRLAPLEDLALEASGIIYPMQMDVTDEKSVVALPARLEALGLSVDVLVNNAGYACVGPAEEVSIDEVRKQFETNVFGALAVIQAVLPAMREARRGRIVNVSSVAGLIGLPFLGVYCASKFALEGLSDALRLELAPFGIAVALVEPAAIASDFAATSETMLRVETQSARNPNGYQTECEHPVENGAKGHIPARHSCCDVTMVG